MRVLLISALACFLASPVRAQEGSPLSMGSLEYHLSAGLPSGLAGGVRYRIENVSLEASVGTYISALVFTAGFNFHRSLEREESHPTISLVGSYFKRHGDWYNVSLMLGVLSLTKREMHGNIRGGISFLFTRPNTSERKLRITPLPALELGVGYTIR